MLNIRKLFLIFIIVSAAFIACNNNVNEKNSDDSTGISAARDSTSSTTLPDTMYDNSNQDSLQ